MRRSKAIIPEVIEPDSALPADLVALRRFAYLMDEAVGVPGTRMRFGLDAALGLIPGIGDIIAGLLSGWIVIAAVRHRVPLLKVARMTVNILLDVGVGAIPLIGDVFDFFFEENVINLKTLLLYRDRRRSPRTPFQMIFLALAVLAIILGFAVAIVGALIWLLILLTGFRS